ncbi:hypothetical protein ABBQ38_015358 [Trebouxia sp. C0009 RCD-2024]
MHRVAVSRCFVCDRNWGYCSSASRQQSLSTVRSAVHSSKLPVVMTLGTALQHMQEDGCVYLDYNATTPIFPEVAQAMEPYLKTHFGNPSSGHSYGRRCKAAVQIARKQVADMIGAQPEEIFFTSSGTESDHWAIWGARACRPRASGGHQIPHIVTSAIEHPAVVQYLDALQQEDLICCTSVGVSAEGTVDPADVQAAVTNATCLISIMHSNNEVGSLQPIADIAQIARQHKILLHSDAAQSIGKVSVDVQELGVDLLTIVGHKFGAPKGVAALYIRKGVQLSNFFLGGGQEAGRRAGTENVLGIVGLGAAAEIVTKEQALTTAHMAAMRDDLQARLLRAFPQGVARVNGPACSKQRLPNTLSISIKGLRASELLSSSQDDLAASAGAACHSSQQATVSSVLQAMQVPVEYAVGTLRLSTGRHTVEQDIVKAAELILAHSRQQGVTML